MPGLNDLLAAKSSIQGKWNAYNQVKNQWYGQIKLLALARGIEPQGPGMATMLFIEPHRQRDPDNVVGAGAKLLLDSFVGAGVLPGDGWSVNLGFVGYWICRTDGAGCLFHWGDELLDKAAMLQLLEKEQNGTSDNGYRASHYESDRAPARKAACRHAQPHRKLGGG